MNILVTGVPEPGPYVRLFLKDKALQREVEELHDIHCGCENGALCCLLRRGFVEEKVRELRGDQEEKR